MKHGGDVVRIAELARCDDAWHEGLDVVVVRFCSPELSGKGAECVGVDRVFCFVRGEAGLADEGGEAVVLGGLRDGLVLRRELRDRPPRFLFGGDGLVGGLAADTAEPVGGQARLAGRAAYEYLSAHGAWRQVTGNREGQDEGTYLAGLGVDGHKSDGIGGDRAIESVVGGIGPGSHQ